MSWLKAMREKEPPEPENPIGIVVIGLLEGDRIHKSAKEMVRKSLKGAQFKTVDLGKGALATKFASTAKGVNADIIAASMNTTEAKDNLPKLLSAIEAEGLKGKVAVMVGGAAVTKEDADKVGVLYGKKREDAVALAKKVMEEKKG
jgi:5-methyltetrahydrofolate--homocysteine methyltransferase